MMTRNPLPNETRRTMPTTNTERGARRRSLLLAAAALLPLLAACNTDVTNPGRVEDEFLDDPAAHAALVAGMGRSVAQALNWISYTSAAVTREVHPSGSTGSFGITNRWQQGELAPNDSDLDTHWEQAQRARWLAETGSARIEKNENAPRELLAQAYLWAGYANRLLGENMCEAVFDGSAPEPGSAYFTRAEQHFTRANELAAAAGASGIATAALAGRASARIFLGKWTEAVADAAQVPADFVFEMPYYNVGEDAQRNRIAYASLNTPYRAHTVWNTVYEAYFTQTGDPRVAWEDTGLVGDAAIECCGRVPFYRQLKHSASDSPIRLSSGREMDLIEAEAALRNGDWQNAVAIINALRAAVPAPEVSAANETEAWALLKRERGIELWLEGRRLGDLRRWSESGTPGALDPLETPSGSVADGSHLVRQDLCFPIPPTEQDTNPNVPRVS